MAKQKQYDQERLFEFQTQLEGVANYLARDIQNVLSEADKATVNEIIAALAGDLSKNLSVPQAMKRLNELKAKLQSIRETALEKAKERTLHVALKTKEKAETFERDELADLTGRKPDKIKKIPKKEADALLKYQPFVGQSIDEWFARYKTNDLTRIATAVTQAYAERISIADVRKKIMGTKAGNYQDGILVTSRNSATTLARTIVNGVANEARLETMMANEDVIDGLQFVATLDGRTSFICASLDGTIWKGADMKNAKRPPIHPNCYDSETQVYTDEGWKYFENVHGREQFLSINPQTMIPEWTRANAVLSYKHEGELIHFTNDRFDLMVTPNHLMFGENRSSGCKRGYRFVEAAHINHDKFRIPSGAKWEGIFPNEVYLADRPCDPWTYVRFMAFWLADGSTSKASKNTRYVKISQCESDWMMNELTMFPFEIRQHKQCLMVYNTELGSYLKRFGHCTEKYIPEDIFGMSPELIEEFLYAYARTDGYIHKGKFWKGYQFQDTVSFFTTSHRMMSGLCELILKAGGRPSVVKSPSSGRKICFRNGEYVVNHDCYIISWLKQTGTYSGNLNIESVPASEKVYCVELEKNHTLWVMRSGKTCWCGNCRSTLVPYIEILDENGKPIEQGGRPAAAEDFERLAKELYEGKAKPGAKSWNELSPSTRKKYYYAAQKDYTSRTGKPAYTQVPGKTTFKDYFEKQPESFQRSWLGPKRYELYKEGKLSFESLVKSDTGHVVPVEALGVKSGANTGNNGTNNDKKEDVNQSLRLPNNENTGIIKKEEEVTISSIEAKIESLKSAFRDIRKDPGHSSKEEEGILEELGRVLKVKEELLAAQKEQDEKRAAEIAEQERKKEEEEKAKAKAELEKKQKEEAEKLEALRKKKKEEENNTLDIDLTKIPVSKEELEKMIANKEPILEPCDGRPMNAFYAPKAIKLRRKAIQEIEEKQKGEIEDAASNLGISVDEFVKRCETKIKKELENAGLYRRIDHEDLFKVLQSGKFKSQFETGASDGAYNPPLRSDAEFNMFGYENDVNKNQTERPIYGYIDYKDKPTGQSTETTSDYGDCIVQFKEDVKKRTTFCSNDSLVPGRAKRIACSSILNPNITTMRNIGDYLDSDERLIVPEGKPLPHGYYTEAQFHGEVAVDDIECVFIKQAAIYEKKINERQIQRLKDKGLIVEIIK